MTPEENAARIREFVERVWNGHDPDAIGDYHADEFTMNGETQTPAQFSEALHGYFTFCPDLHETIEAMVAQDDRVAYRWAMRGTDPRTGGEFAVNGMSMSRMVDGKIVEEWYYADQTEDDVAGIVAWLEARQTAPSSAG